MVRIISRTGGLMTVALGLFVPVLALAAYNDVTVTSSASLSVGGIPVNVSGSSWTIQSIQVGASSFTVTMAPGSIFTATAPNRNILSVTGTTGNVGQVPTCNNSSSILQVVPDSSVVSSITISPQSGLCTTPASSGSGGGGGGNGPPVGSIGGWGGSVIPKISTTTSSTLAGKVTAPSSASQTTTQGTSKFIPLGKVLRKGSKDPSVKTLQQMLNSDPDTQIATSGVGSPGNETTLFGEATRKALQKFQTKWGIVKSGQRGYGMLGPKTRAKLNALYAQ